jgi:hypothetical protein
MGDGDSDGFSFRDGIGSAASFPGPPLFPQGQLQLHRAVLTMLPSIVCMSHLQTWVLPSSAVYETEIPYRLTTLDARWYLLEVELHR